MNRRDTLLAILALGTIAGPSDVRAQQTGKLRRVGYLSNSTAANQKFQEDAFFGAMRELGWIEGQNIVYDRAYAEYSARRLASLAATLVRRNPDLIYAISLPPAMAAFASTHTIPIVFGAANDPIQAGLVKSLARPGGNATGIANIGWELGGKRLQLLAELLPKVNRVGVLVNPKFGESLREQELIEEAAIPLKIVVIPATVRSTADLDAAIEYLSKSGFQVLMTTHIAFFLNLRRRILDITAKMRIPFIAHRSEIAEDGALMSYSSMLKDQIRRSAQMVDKVLRGANPADIPVELPTEYELVINRKTAKSIGIAIPANLLLRANRVIE